MMEHQKKCDKRKCPTCLKYHVLPNSNCPSNKGWFTVHANKGWVKVHATGWLKKHSIMDHNIKPSELECCFCSYTQSCVGAAASAMQMHITQKHGEEIHESKQLGVPNEIFTPSEVENTNGNCPDNLERSGDIGTHSFVHDMAEHSEDTVDRIQPGTCNYVSYRQAVQAVQAVLYPVPMKPK